MQTGAKARGARAWAMLIAGMGMIGSMTLPVVAGEPEAPAAKEEAPAVAAQEEAKPEEAPAKEEAPGEEPTAPAVPDDNAEPAPAPEAKPEPKLEAKPEAKGEPKGEPKPEPKAEPKPEPKPRERKPLHFGFDEVKPWVVPNWCDGAELKKTETEKTEGEAALQVVAQHPKQGKIAISAAFKDVELADFATAQIDVHAGEARSVPVLLTLAFQLAGKGGWVESVPQILQPGWNKGLTFDLYEPTWKTEATKWAYQTAPLAKGKAAGLFLLVHGLDYGESVILDNLRLALAAENAAPPPDAELKGDAAARSVARSEQASKDLSRAEAIRAYVCETLNAYAANLERAGRAEAAASVAGTVDKALAAPLVARAMPEPKPELKPEPKAKPKAKPEGKDKPGPSPQPQKEPEAKKDEPATPSVPADALVIQVPASGETIVDGKAVRGFFLKGHLKELAQKNPDRPAIVRYAPGVVLAKFSKVTDTCKAVGFTNVQAVEGATE